MTTPEQKTETLFGGRLVTICLAGGQTEEVRVRQVPLADYEKGFTLLGDEMALTAFICGKPMNWLTGEPGTRNAEPGTSVAAAVTPESYELLRTTAAEVNERGFFAWSARRAQREQETQARMVSAMATLPPETLKMALEAGAMGSAARTTLPTLSPKSSRAAA